MTTQEAQSETGEQTTTWAIDPAHTVVEFAVKHMMFSTVKGTFRGVEGTITRTGDKIEAVKADIDAATVSTGADDRDGHLKSADFFDVENFPVLKFESKRVEDGEGKNAARVIGDLTIRGVTREVTLDVSLLGEGVDPWGGTRAGAEATTRINRKDYGLEWNQVLETGGVLVGDTIRITLHVQAVRQDQ